MHRQPKGLPRFWTRARRLLWSWWPWALAAFSLTSDKWGWAIGTGSHGARQLPDLTPTEFPPRYGLDHEFAVDDEEFLPTMAGATGVPFLPGNRLDILNNGDEFYPAMLEAIARRRDLDHDRGLHLLGRRHRPHVRGRAGGEGEGRRAGSRSCSTRSARSTIGDEILKTLESGRCQLAWYNPIRWYTLGRFNHRTHRKSLIIDGRLAFTGGAGIADHWRGKRTDPAHWRDMQIRIEGPAVTPLQTGFAHNWLQTTGELISGPLLLPADRAGRARSRRRRS